MITPRMRGRRRLLDAYMRVEHEASEASREEQTVPMPVPTPEGSFPSHGGETEAASPLSRPRGLTVGAASAGSTRQ